MANIDLSRLTPEPWEPDFDCGDIEGILQMVWHGNANTIASTGENYSHTNLAFIALARRAFGIMMRRGWGVKRLSGPPAFAAISWEGGIIGAGFAPDPFTALCEAEDWWIANIEKGPSK